MSLLYNLCQRLDSSHGPTAEFRDNVASQGLMSAQPRPTAPSTLPRRRWQTPERHLEYRGRIDGGCGDDCTRDRAGLSNAAAI